MREKALKQISQARDYTTIAVSQADDQIASYALQPAIRTKILERSARICAGNIDILERWIANSAGFAKWLRPEGAGTCIVILLNRNGEVIDDAMFAERLAQEEGVLAPPASVTFDTESRFDLRGGLRIGVVMKQEVFIQGLAGIERLLRRWPS